MGESRVTNMILKMLGTDIRSEIDSFIDEAILRNYITMCDIYRVKEIFDEAILEFLSTLTEDELLIIRSYTGYNYKFINAIMRGNWNYENNGSLDQNKASEFRKLSLKLRDILSKFNIPDINFVTFRGTTLDAFSSYGIRDLDDLENMTGKFVYDQGFVSTSILKNTSYFNKQLDDGRFCNIGIKYLIPSESNDGALLVNNNMSYSVNQNEFLLNSGSLSKVVDVQIDKNNNTAILTVLLVPKKVYDKSYDIYMDNSRNR